MDYKNTKTGETEELFNVKTAKIVEKKIRPEEEQEEFESRRWVLLTVWCFAFPLMLTTSSLHFRLWTKVTDGIKEKNLDKATENKTAIEDAQRQRVREREEKNETWTPRFFVQRGEKFYPKVEALPEEMQSEVVQKYFANHATASGSSGANGSE